MGIVFAVAIFVSAALVFWLELMVAKSVLPRFGGGPAVWNTCVLFFQAVLLLGYGYAHLLPARLRLGRQVLVHGVVAVLPVLVIHAVDPVRWGSPSSNHPVIDLLGYLTAVAGVPFFVVCTTTPLLQRWFADTGHRAARDPYFLYAASSAGSFAGLLGYPALVEPTVGLRTQGLLWEVGYVTFLAVLAVCVALARRSRPAAGVPAAGSAVGGGAPTARLRAYWVVLSFVPSSLMLGVTTHLTTELAPVPLLWVAPLAVYLLTFVIAFGRLPVSLLGGASFTLPALVVGVAWVMTDSSVETAKVYGAMKRLIPLHLATLFVAGLVLHGRLARARPGVRHLTEYYFWVSLGGVLGGLFNGLVAPLVLTTTAEYPLALVSATLLAPPWWEVRAAERVWWLVWAVPVTAAVVAGGLFAANTGKPPTPGERVLHRERNFFGVHTITTDPTGLFNVCYHGKTRHGMQNAGDPRFRRLPLLYYYHNGPVGQLMFAFRGEQAKKHVAVIGLGAGTLATYGEKGQEITFYEIDPAVERAARSHFTYLADSPATCRVVMGDGRRSVEREPDGKFGILVIDAFSSDAVPVHLITTEAIRLYLDKLTPDGLLAVHISNNYLDLEPVVAALARECGLEAIAQLDTQVTPAESKMGKSDSHWVVLARSRTHFGKLADDPRWRAPRRRDDLRAWTDDYSNLFRVLNWN